MSSSVQFGKVWYGIVWFEKARLNLASGVRYGYFDFSPTLTMEKQMKAYQYKPIWAVLLSGNANLTGVWKQNPLSSRHLAVLIYPPRYREQW